MAADFRALEGNGWDCGEFKKIGGHRNRLVEVIPRLADRILFDQKIGGKLNPALFKGLADAGRQQRGIAVVTTSAGEGVMPGPGIPGVGFSFEHQNFRLRIIGNDGGNGRLFFGERFHNTLYSKFPFDTQGGNSEKST